MRLIRCVGLLLLLTVLTNCSEYCQFTNDDENQDGNSMNGADTMKYGFGKSYVYKLDSEVRIGISNGKSEEDPEGDSFRLEALAKIKKSNDCEFCLTLGLITITSKSGKVQEFDDHGGSLIFFYEDFRLREHLYHEKRNDSIMSANIKRAVVSMLQTSIKEFEGWESDIIGSCPTYYSISEDGIQKQKNIHLCKHNFADSESAPLILILPPVSLKNSTYSCTHKIKDGIVDNVHCFESYEFDESLNIRTTIKSSLLLVEIKSEDVTEDICTVNSDSQYSVSWIFYGNTGSQSHELTKAIKTTLETLAENINSGFTSSKFVENLFTLQKLVGAVKNTEILNTIEETIEEINKRFPNQITNKWLKEIFLEVLSEEPNHGALEFIIDSLKKGTLPIDENFLLQLIKKFPWIGDFGSRTFSSALNMMKIFDVYSFSKDVKIKLLSFITNEVADAMTLCNTKNSHEGNASQWIYKEFKKQINLLPVLEKIEVLKSSVEDTAQDNPTLCSGFNENSVASTVDELYCTRNALRSLCGGNAKSKVRNILKNTTAPSDVRIQAYLAITECKDADDVAIIKTLFENPDENNDLLGFIASRAENRPSEIVDDAIQQLILSFKQKQPRGRTLSKYYAYTFGNDKAFMILRINVVFSSVSFIPSSLETEIFIKVQNGQKINLSFGIFTSKLETLVDKLMFKSHSSDDSTVEDGEVLIYLRQFGRTNYFRKFSVEELENILLDFYLKILDYEKPDWLQILSEDKIINYFLPYTFVNDENIISTAGGIPISWRNEGKAFLFSSLSTEGLQDLNWNNLSVKAKINPSIGASHSLSVAAGFENYEIGIKREIKFHSFLYFQLATSKTNASNLNLRFDVPQEKLFSLGLSKKIFHTNFINYDYESRPLKQLEEIEKMNGCYADDFGLKFCSKRSSKNDGGTWFDYRFDASKTSSSFQGISIDLDNVIKGNDREIVINFIKLNQRSNEASRIADVYFQYQKIESKENVAVGIHSPWLYSDLKISGVDTDILKQLDISFAANGDKYAAILYYKKIYNPANDKTALAKTGYHKGILCPLDLFCNVEYDILIQFSGSNFKNSMNILEIRVTQDYKESLNFKVSTGGPFKVAQASLQGSVWYSERRSDEEEQKSTNVAVGVSVEVIYKPLGTLQLNNTWTWTLKQYEDKLNSDMFTWNAISEYGRHENPNKNRLSYQFTFGTSLFFANDTARHTKESFSHELRCTQFPSPFLNFNIEMDRVALGAKTDSKTLGHIIFNLRVSPFGDANREVKFVYENKKYRWESFYVFLVDDIFSVSHQGSSLSLKTFIDRQTNKIISDIVWDVIWLDSYVTKFSLAVDTTSKERILIGTVKFQNHEYQIETNRLLGTNTEGSKKINYHGNLIGMPRGVNLLSYALLIEPDVKSIVIKLKNEKYLEYELKRKNEDFQIVNKLFVKDLADGNGILKLNKDGNLWPIEIHIDTKILPKELKILAKFILQLTDNGEISADTNIKWQPIGAENNLLGKINGKAQLNFVTRVIHALYDIHKNNQDSKLKIHGNLKKVSGRRIISYPEIEINLKMLDETIFELKCIDVDVVDKSPGDSSQFKFQLQNETNIDLRNEYQYTATNIEQGSKWEHRRQYRQEAIIVVSGNGFPLSLFKFPSGIDVHFNGELDTINVNSDRKIRANPTTWNGKATYSSGGGILPRKQLVWTADVNLYPSNDTLDFNNMTERTDAFYWDTKISMLEDAKLTRDVSWTLKLKRFPKTYGNYSSTKYDNSGQKYEKTIFYIDRINKYLSQLNYTVNTARNIDDTNLSDKNTIQGISEFTSMFESWSDFEVSQKQWILIPFWSDVPKEWKTIVGYTTNSNDSETKLIVYQSDVFSVSVILDEDGFCTTKAGVSIKDFESGFLLDFDRNMSWNDIYFTTELITPFPILKAGHISVHHHSSNSDRSYFNFLVMLKDKFEINGHYVPQELHSHLGLNISGALDLILDMRLIDENKRPTIHITLLDGGEKSFEFRTEFNSNMVEKEIRKWNATYDAVLNGTFIPAGMTVKAFLSTTADLIDNPSDGPKILKENINGHLVVIRRSDTDENNMLTLTAEVELESGGNCHNVFCYQKENYTKSCIDFSYNCNVPLQFIILH